MLRAIQTIRQWSGPAIDEVVLDYEDRHRRRVVIQAQGGTRFLLDLAQPADIRDGDGIELSSAAVVRVRAAEESLIEISCADPHQLARIAWHIGNRHIPAEIGPSAIRIRSDHVIADMVVRLGAHTRAVIAPFDPEAGAYAQPSPHSHRQQPIDFEMEDALP